MGALHVIHVWAQKLSCYQDLCCETFFVKFDQKRTVIRANRHIDTHQDAYIHDINAYTYVNMCDTCTRSGSVSLHSHVNLHTCIHVTCMCIQKLHIHTLTSGYMHLLMQDLSPSGAKLELSPSLQ